METFYGSYHGNIIKGIADIFIDLWDWFNFIWEAIKAIPQAIIDLLGNLLKLLFIPSENFFNDNIEEIKEKISEKIPIFRLTDPLSRIIIHHAPRCKGELSYVSYFFSREKVSKRALNSPQTYRRPLSFRPVTNKAFLRRSIKQI